MGTNFYLEEDGTHIGKSSGGWCFSLHIYPENGINSLEDWKKEWAGKQISDEYGRLLSEEEMLGIITNRNWNSCKEKSDAFLRQNHAVRGPNNLLRSEVDGIHCVGHGDGTWDYCIGDFS